MRLGALHSRGAAWGEDGNTCPPRTPTKGILNNPFILVKRPPRKGKGPRHKDASRPLTYGAALSGQGVLRAIKRRSVAPIALCPRSRKSRGSKGYRGAERAAIEPTRPIHRTKSPPGLNLRSRRARASIGK